jgi:hypothetical protein
VSGKFNLCGLVDLSGHHDLRHGNLFRQRHLPAEYDLLRRSDLRWANVCRFGDLSGRDHVSGIDHLYRNGDVRKCEHVPGWTNLRGIHDLYP